MPALTRRQTLFGSLAWAPGAWLAGCATVADDPPPPPEGVALAAADLAWLNRITWGASASSAVQLSRLGRERFLARQLDPRAPGALPAALQAQIDAMRVTRTPMDALVLEMEQQRKAADAHTDDEQKKAAQQAYQQELNRLAREASARMLLRAVYSPAQLREQMTWFWFNHFNVHQYKHNLRAMVGDCEEALRAHALGRFRDLLGASALHPAMLRYLDNEANAANRLNENYARELLELHTLGVDGGYTQADVQELARVLTGLGVNLSGQPVQVRPQLQTQVVAKGLMLFNPQRHDMGDKRVLGGVVKGRGFDEINEVLDRLAQHPSTARFVSRKIATYFVADEPQSALIERMAQRFLQSEGRIAEVLRTMFESPEFEASLAGDRRKFKDPTRYVVSAARAAYDREPIANAQPLVNALYRMGQAPYNRQTPDGYPLTEAAWASPGQMATRFEIARQLGAGHAGLFRPEAPAASAAMTAAGMGGAAMMNTAMAGADTAQNKEAEAQKQREAQQRALPQLAKPQLQRSWQAVLSPATRAALDQAKTPQEWNTLFLSSPEFMLR
jgi:uncharacterized protein (DUF1800 family)